MISSIACDVRPSINSNIRRTLRVFTYVCSSRLKTLSIKGKPRDVCLPLNAEETQAKKYKKGWSRGPVPKVTSPSSLLCPYATYSISPCLCSRGSPTFILPLRFFAILTHLQALQLGPIQYLSRAVQIFNGCWRKTDKGRMFHVSTKSPWRLSAPMDTGGLNATISSLSDQNSVVLLYGPPGSEKSSFCRMRLTTG